MLQSERVKEIRKALGLTPFHKEVYKAAGFAYRNEPYAEAYNLKESV